MQPTGLVVSIPSSDASAFLNRNYGPEHQRLLSALPQDRDGSPVPEISDFARFAQDVFGWDTELLLGSPGAEPVPAELEVNLENYNETLRPTYALRSLNGEGKWLLLVEVLPTGIDLDQAFAPHDRGWQASPQARFERLLRQTPTTGQVPTRYSPVRHSLETKAPRAFDLHVLGMPPAFVLSQDQTLKFILGPSVLTRTPLKLHTPKRRRPERTDPYQGLQNARKCASVRQPAPPPAHPFPSLQSQSTIPQAVQPQPASRPARLPTTAGPRLYPHPQPPVNPPDPVREPIPERGAAASRDRQSDAACPEAYTHKFAISDQSQRAQLGEHVIGQRQHVGRRAIGRRRFWRQIAPTLKRPARSR